MVPSPPTALDVTIQETMVLLDGPFADFARGIAEDRYAIWLGSGISFSRLPSLEEVAESVIEHVRSRIDPTNDDCVFKCSLDAILGLTALNPVEWKRIEFSKPFAEWTDRISIRKQLVLNYARMLDLAPTGLPEDYMVWDAVDVTKIYGDPNISPAAEHLALAALILEGVASDIASANWDGLLEKAIAQLAGSTPHVMQVCILADDVRGVSARAKLYKFHGCAVLAGKDEAIYRPKLVGRFSQINSWASENVVINHKLVDLILSKPTLMLGLSVQDTNIQRLFVDAHDKIPWIYPSNPPALVFSEDVIGGDQRSLLRNFYKNQYGTEREKIESKCLLRAYGTTLLPSLWLHVISAKLSAIIDQAVPAFAQTEKDALGKGLKILRDAAAASAKPKQHDSFITHALTIIGRALNLFRIGHSAVSGGGVYSPISDNPLQKILHGSEASTSGLRELSLGLALFGYGQSQGDWICEVSSSPTLTTGAAQIKGVRNVEVFFAASPQAAANMVLLGHIEDNDNAVVVHSQPVVQAAGRSPSSSYGRTGRIGLREISLRTLADNAVDLSDLFREFKGALAL